MVLGLTRPIAAAIIPLIAALALLTAPARAQGEAAPAAKPAIPAAAAATPSGIDPAQPLANGPQDKHAQPANSPTASPQNGLAIDVLRTRFLIGLEKPVKFQVTTLSVPNHRILVDLPDIKLQLPKQPEGNAVGLVHSFRGGLAAPGTNRIIIDVTEPVIVESAKIEKGEDGTSQFLALQIVSAAAATKDAGAGRKALKTQPYALGAAGVQPPLPAPAKRPSDRASKAFKPIIVLDPGHGGHDSGAEKNGAIEKEVVLAFALKLRDKLNKTGRYKVMMTREDDRFIELSERVDFAERNNANLFIAIHADYATTRARGATIYSLRESTAESLKRSAKGDVSENVLTSEEAAKAKSAGEGSDLGILKGILADLAGREVETTRERTGIFSRAVIETMSEATTMRDDPDQTAGYRVLKTAQFPSVLIELAYVTNKEDAEQLKSEIWRDKVSDSIMTAIENYFSNQLARLPM
jgi:N-acetylmuramoyl-L-alanine amidase